MPKKMKPIEVERVARPSVRLEVRLVIEDTEFDGASKLFAGELEVSADCNLEDIENAVFALAVDTINTAGWDIGLGEIFEVVDG